MPWFRPSTWFRRTALDSVTRIDGSKPLTPSPVAFVAGVSIPTLVVIDMQTGFITADHDCVGHVATQMKLFIENRWPIVIVEYQGNGDTHAQLLGLVENKYDLWTKATKRSSGGGKETIEACVKPEFNFDTSYFRCCGVYTDACVFNTVKGLMVERPGALIEVIKEACSPVSFGCYSSLTNVIARTEEEARNAEASMSPRGDASTFIATSTQAAAAV